MKKVLLCFACLLLVLASSTAFAVNVVQNPGFEKGTGTAAYPWIAGWGTAAAVTNPALAHSGQRCWEITAANGTAIDSFGACSQPRACKPGQTFSISAWVRLPSASASYMPKVRLRYGFLNAANAFTSVNAWQDFYLTTSDWTQISLSAPLVAPSDAAYLICRVYVYNAYQDGTGVDIVAGGANYPAYVDDFVADSNDGFQAISGTVTSGGVPLADARVALVEPSTQFVWDAADTDANGNYTLMMSPGTYDVHARKAGYTPNPARAKGVVVAGAPISGLNFSLSPAPPPSRTVPQPEQLLFAVLAESLPDPEAGFPMPAGDWPLLAPAGQSLTQINSPQAELINGTKWIKNLYNDGDGFRLNNTEILDPIPVNGVTVVAAVKPVRNAIGDGWNSVVDLFYNRVVLGVRNNTGRVNVIRNGTQNYAASGTAIRDGQTTILSLVIQPDGNYKCWANGVEVLNVTTTDPNHAMTSLVPGVPGGYARYMNIGRNNPDGWTTYNGGIGDVFVYKVALTDAERALLETDLTTRFRASSTTYTITPSVGPGGSINPSTPQIVAAEADRTFTITPAPGYAVADVVVNGVSVGAVTSYTFHDVVANGTIHATFVNLPKQPVSGRVTDQSSGAGVGGAKVYFSGYANASLNPAYTATTDAAGNYTIEIPTGTWFACASQDRYVTSNDISVTVSSSPVANANVALVTSGRNIPAMDKLIFGALSRSFPESGAIPNWVTFHPKSVTMQIIATPTVQKVGNVKWSQNLSADGDGFRYNATAITSPIPCNGASIVTVVKHTPLADGGNWNSIVDVFYNRLVLGIYNDTGQLVLFRNGERMEGGAGSAVPGDQPTVLSMVAQPTGEVKVWMNGNLVMDVTTTSDMSPTGPGLVPGIPGAYANFINIGRNNPDGWTTFNGFIGDTFLYKAALTDAERQQLEADLADNFLMTITGRVIDNNGVGVPGASVIVADIYGQPVASGTTAANGTYTIVAPNLGNWMVYAYKIGYEPFPSVEVYVEVTATGPNPAPDIILTGNQLVPMSGYVRNELGVGVAGATIEARAFSGGPVEKTATTNASGYYTLELPYGFEYFVTASAPKHVKSEEVYVLVLDFEPITQNFVCKDLSTPVINIDAADATIDGWPNKGVYGGAFLAKTGAIAVAPAGPAGDLRMGVDFNGSQWLNLVKDGAWVPAGPEITGRAPHSVAVWIYNPIPASNNSWRDAYISWSPQGMGAAGNGMYLGMGWQVWGSAVCGFDAGATPTINWPGSNSDFETALAESTAPWGRWAHVTTTYDGTRYRIYVDGVERTAMSRTYATNTATGYQIYLGGAAAGAAEDAGRWGDSAFTGSIARLKMYAYALEPAEITADFQDAPGGATVVTVSTIAALKALPVDTLVQLTGPKTAIYAPRDEADVRSTNYFYIGEAQGLGGLRVERVATDSMRLGRVISNITGTVKALPSGEKYLKLSADPGWVQGTAIPVLGMNNKTVATDAKAQTNAVRVWGKVVMGTGSFTIDDGYNAPITVVVNGVALPADLDGKTAVVTGVVSKDNAGNPVVLLQSVTAL